MRPARPALTLVVLILGAAALRLAQGRYLPPGLWYDEAWISLRARDMAAGGVYPVYFAAPFGGNHAAIVYLTWLSRALSQDDPLAVRYVAMAAGILLTPLTYLALRAILQVDGDDERRRERAALMGAAGAASAVPLVVLSRVGFEVLLPALCGCVILWAGARAWATGRLIYYGLAGIALGLALHTYSAARFFPLAVGILGLGGLYWRTRWRWRVVGWLLAGAVAGLIVWPLAVYFWRQADIFTTRAATASFNTLGPGATSVPLAVLRNIGRTVAGLSWPGWGDGLLRHNVPGAPFFDAWFSLCFWLGATRLWRRRRQPSTFVLVVWGAVMTLPVILTDGAPTFTRWLSAAPALLGVAGMGAVWLARQVGRRVGIRPNIILLAGCLFSFAWAGWRYFGVYAHEPGLFDAFQVGDWQAATLAQARLASDQVYLIPDPINDGSPTFDLLLRGSGAQGLPPDCLAYMPGRPNTYLINQLQDAHSLPALTGWVGGAAEEPIRHQPTLTPLYTVWRAPADATPERPPSGAAQFGPALRLLGAAATPAVTGVHVQLVWQVVGEISAEPIPFLHLYPAQRFDIAPLSQDDAPPCQGQYPFSRWPVGQIVREDRVVAWPSDEPNANYTLALGVYTWPDMQRLPVIAPDTLPDNRLPLPLP